MNRLSSWISWLLLGSMCGYFYLLNTQIPLYANDYCYAYHQLDFSSAWSNAQNDYFNWSGRFPVMLLNRLLYSTSDFSILLLSVLNTISMIGCLFLVKKTSQTNNSFQLLLVSVVFCFLFWFSTRYFGEAVLWKTGQVQFFWGAIIATACLLPTIQTIIWRNQQTKSTIQIILLGGLCFLGSMWLENLSIAVILVWTILLIYAKWFQRRKIPTWIWLTFICWLIGTLILLGAPSSIKRAEPISESIIFLNNISALFDRFLDQIDTRLWALYLVFLPLCRINNKHNFYRALQQSIVFILLALFSTLAISISSQTQIIGHPIFPSQFFLMFAVISIFPIKLLLTETTNLIPSSIRLTIICCLLLLIIPLSLDAKNIYYLYYNIAQQNRDRLDAMTLQIGAGITNTQLTPLYFSAHRNTFQRHELNRRHWYAYDITRDPNHWANNCLARFYKIDSVALVLSIPK